MTQLTVSEQEARESHIMPRGPARTSRFERSCPRHCEDECIGGDETCARCNRDYMILQVIAEIRNVNDHYTTHVCIRTMSTARDKTRFKGNLLLRKRGGHRQIATTSEDGIVYRDEPMIFRLHRFRKICLN